MHEHECLYYEKAQLCSITTSMLSNRMGKLFPSCHGCREVFVCVHVIVAFHWTSDGSNSLFPVIRQIRYYLLYCVHTYSTTWLVQRVHVHVLRSETTQPFDIHNCIVPGHSHQIVNVTRQALCTNNEIRQKSWQMILMVCLASIYNYAPYLYYAIEN